MKKILLIHCVVLLTMLLAGAARATDSDDRITDTVKQTLLADGTLAATAIDVDTDNGVVMLKGKVIGTKEADRAIELARAVPGVVSVKSELNIDTHITNGDVNKRLDEREETTEKQKEMLEEHHSDSGDNSFLTDAAITAAVKAKLAKDELGSLYRIDVDTKDGVVALRGSVKSASEAERLIQLAAEVKGVKKVSSSLLKVDR